MEIKIFGPGCQKCAQAFDLAQKVAKEAGVDAEIVKITDFKEMLASGVMSTPAVAINDKIVCVGRVPDKAEMWEWINGTNAGQSPG